MEDQAWGKYRILIEYINGVFNHLTLIKLAEPTSHMRIVSMRLMYKILLDYINDVLPHLTLMKLIKAEHSE